MIHAKILDLPMLRIFLIHSCAAPSEHSGHDRTSPSTHLNQTLAGFDILLPSNLLIYTPGSGEFIIWQRRVSHRDWFDTVFVGWFLTIEGSLKYLTHQVKIWVAKMHRKKRFSSASSLNVSQVPLRFFEPQDLCNSTNFIAARWSFQMYHFFKALNSNPPLGGWSACLFEKCAL